VHSMVDPQKGGTALWAGNEEWPGTGAWQDDGRDESVQSLDSDNDEPARQSTNFQEQQPEQPNQRRQAVWGMLRAMQDGPSNSTATVDPEPFNAEEHLTPRTASLRRVFGAGVDEMVQSAHLDRRQEGLEFLLEHLGRTKVSQGGLVLLDPSLRLEAVNRDEFLCVARDLIRRVVCDPSDHIRGHAVALLSGIIESFGRHASQMELALLVKSTIAAILGDATRPVAPEGDSDYAVLDLLISNDSIGAKAVIEALYSYVKDPSQISRPASNDWLLLLLNKFLNEHHLAPAGLIPLEPTIAYAIRWLAVDRAPAKRREVAMSLVSSLYRLAQKRIDPLILEIPSKVHRQLMDEFAKIDNQKHIEARKVRTRVISAGSRSSTATGGSRKERGRRPSIAGYIVTGVREQVGGAPQVAMDMEVMIKGLNGVRKKEQTDLEMLGNATHLHCGSKGIVSISNLEQARKVQVLYLHDNYISKIENLFHLSNNLTHLYLQNNSIQCLEGLDECMGLQKLYLGGNRIQLIEGLRNCPYLEELHLNDQKLPKGCHLEFCPGSMQTLSRSLRVLHASKCAVADVSPLWCLQRLDDLDLSGSCVEHAQPVNQLVSGCPFLTKLDLSGSPVASQRQSCSEIIAHADYIEEFNGKVITAKERDFMKRLVHRQAATGTRRASVSEGMPRDRRKSVSGGLGGPASRGLGATCQIRARRGSL